MGLENSGAIVSHETINNIYSNSQFLNNKCDGAGGAVSYSISNRITFKHVLFEGNSG